MPTYEHYCTQCDTITEATSSIADRKQFIPCRGCGSSAERIISCPSIQCDSGTDVKWLNSACQNLQKDGERPIQSRGEYKRYLTTHGIVERC
jgi:putative FmdB family regulatory protein